MLKGVKTLIPIVLLIQFLSVHAEPDAVAGVESLTPEIRLLLSQEMIAIQNGMMAIIPANASGNTRKIATIAKEIKDSYILQQNLTPEQKHELHTKLPRSFIQLDKKFHYYAGMLEHVAEEKKHELIGFYFTKMAESCSQCHSRHAKHRFPEFANNKAATTGHAH